MNIKYDSCLTQVQGGATLLNEVQMLFLFLSILVDGVVLKLFFEMKWTETARVSLIVNFLSGVLYITIGRSLLILIFSPGIFAASVFLLVPMFVVLLFVVSLKLFLVHVIFKISITKFRFLLFIIASILAVLFTLSGSVVYDKIAVKMEWKEILQ